jgi:3-methyladenine DNA glycosylase AlkD
MVIPKASSVVASARKLADKDKAVLLQGFFKTGKGQYGEGDIFWGLMVPQSRSIAERFSNLPLTEIKKLLQSKIHEIRLIGLLILVQQYNKSSNKKTIVDFYLKNLRYINNWDLVDLTAPKILGNWLLSKPTTILNRLANSKNLWEKRVAVLACFPRIKNNDFKLVTQLAQKFLKEEHDLMHKAVGWMLREMGKQSLPSLKQFLKKYAAVMPRTMLRYAIEKFPEKERQRYLQQK